MLACDPQFPYLRCHLPRRASVCEEVTGNEAGWPQSKGMSWGDWGEGRCWPRGTARPPGGLGPGELPLGWWLLTPSAPSPRNSESGRGRTPSLAWPSQRLALHAAGTWNSVGTDAADPVSRVGTGASSSLKPPQPDCRPCEAPNLIPSLLLSAPAG